MPSKDTTQLEQLKLWNDLTQAKSFLSADFLLWLWYYAESELNPRIIQLINDPQEYLVKIWIEDRLLLESNNAMAQMHLLKGGDPSRSLEAESALQTGKGVRELKLGINIDPFGDFCCLLNNKDLAPRAITLPPPAITGETGHQKPSLAYRLKMTQLLTTILDILFQQFLDLRTNSNWWDKTWPSMQKWIDSRGNNENQLH